MSIKPLALLGMALISFASSSVLARPVDKHLQSYQEQGVTQADSAKGEQLWYANDNGRSCSSCHGQTPREIGKHAKTRKAINPMALSINPERYQDSKKIEKWFLRNCKWTFGRVCTTQEKADILTWLSSQ